MNREDIIRMAQETGVTAERVRDLVNFATLVWKDGFNRGFKSGHDWADKMNESKERNVSTL